jgi:basic membrane protein A
VGLAPYHDLEDKVPAELQEEVDALRQDIIDGEVTVESDASPEAA